MDVQVGGIVCLALTERPSAEVGGWRWGFLVNKDFFFFQIRNNHGIKANVSPKYKVHIQHFALSYQMDNAVWELQRGLFLRI